MGRPGPRLGVIQWEESEMPQDTTNLIDVLLLIFGVVIAGFAIGGAVQAWRSWSDHRRIENPLQVEWKKVR